MITQTFCNVSEGQDSGGRAGYIIEDRATHSDPARVSMLNMQGVDAPRSKEDYARWTNDVVKHFEHLKAELEKIKLRKTGRLPKNAYFTGKLAVAPELNQLPDERLLGCGRRFVEKRFGPKAIAVLAVHRDTDRRHLHLLVAKQDIDGESIRFNWKETRKHADRWALIVSNELQKPYIYYVYRQQADEKQAFGKAWKRFKRGEGERPAPPVRDEEIRSRLRTPVRAACCVFLADKPKGLQFNERLSRLQIKLGFPRSDLNQKLCSLTFSFRGVSLKASELGHQFHLEKFRKLIRGKVEEDLPTTPAREMRIHDVGRACLLNPEKLNFILKQATEPEQRDRLVYVAHAARQFRKEGMGLTWEKVDRVITQDSGLDPETAARAIAAGSPLHAPVRERERQLDGLDIPNGGQRSLDTKLGVFLAFKAAVAVRPSANELVRLLDDVGIKLCERGEQTAEKSGVTLEHQGIVLDLKEIDKRLTGKRVDELIYKVLDENHAITTVERERVGAVMASCLVERPKRQQLISDSFVSQKLQHADVNAHRLYAAIAAEVLLRFELGTDWEAIDREIEVRFEAPDAERLIAAGSPVGVPLAKALEVTPPTVKVEALSDEKTAVLLEEELMARNKLKAARAEIDRARAYTSFDPWQVTDSNGFTYVMTYVQALNGRWSQEGEEFFSQIAFSMDQEQNEHIAQVDILEQEWKDVSEKLNEVLQVRENYGLEVPNLALSLSSRRKLESYIAVSRDCTEIEILSSIEAVDLSYAAGRCRARLLVGQVEQGVDADRTSACDQRMIDNQQVDHPAISVYQDYLDYRETESSLLNRFVQKLNELLAVNDRECMEKNGRLTEAIFTGEELARIRENMPVLSSSLREQIQEAIGETPVVERPDGSLYRERLGAWPQSYFEDYDRYRNFDIDYIRTHDLVRLRQIENPPQ
ncbi:MAG: hypothetical protein QOH25_1802 [Acidobacteriota bacterium]|jgi:hypothetical protein|nr:hypothetical protein [Acidobacteriota bacterium]